MNINVHIERLVVEGLGVQPQQREELKAALVAALTQQLISQGSAFSMQPQTSLSSINAGSIAIESSEGIEGLGQQLCHAVFGSISHE